MEGRRMGRYRKIGGEGRREGEEKVRVDATGRMEGGEEEGRMQRVGR